MIRSVVFDLKTESEPNLRFASKGGMFAKANRTKKQRTTTREALNRLGTPPGGWYTPAGAAPSFTLPNRLEVRCTRLGPGLLDEHDNLPVSFKGVVDEIAAWCGMRDNDPRFKVLPAQQTRTPNGSPWRVQIEITDLEPGVDRKLVLASVEREKPAKTKANGAKGGPPSNTLGPGGDEEKSPRQLVPCPRASCFVALDMPCKDDGLASQVWVNGVHWERARAAGVGSKGELVKLDITPWLKAKGPRKVVPSGPRPVPVWIALPWTRGVCETCNGSAVDIEQLIGWGSKGCRFCAGSGLGPERLTLEKRVDGRSAPRVLRYNVPPSHQARFGLEVVLIRGDREIVGGVEGVVFREGKRG